MPHSAVDAGVVDHCLPIPELAQELVRLIHHPYITDPEVAATKLVETEALDAIYAIVRSTIGVDFSEYKAPTFERRLARRMALCKAESRHDYVAMLRQNPQEVRSLYEDALIHVTSFFRDPEAFDALKEHVFPAILRHKPAGTPIRLWVAGCSTGEEVYSLAISLLEFLGDTARPQSIQIFGSDVSNQAIEKARGGIYLESAMHDVSEQRRRRFFVKTERGYRVHKSVRDLCVFARHDLAKDPPFCKLDLASCRNVLIYFASTLQKRILTTLHYCLNQPGFLLLGRTEGVNGCNRLFSTVDAHQKILARAAVPSTLRFDRGAEPRATLNQEIGKGFPDSPRRHADVGTREYLQSLLEEHNRTDGDLASANEELVSSNEELQSINEELETAKEELQSANEELTTVNDELHVRNLELNQANSDLLNLISTADIPVVILDANRAIRRFTPKARTIMNLLPSDVGRPIDDINPNINVTDLDKQLAEVIETITVKESEVQDRQGHWYRMQMRPYKTTDNRIDGAILSLVDIDALKQHIREAEWARDYAAGIVEAVQVPLVVLDENLCTISANGAFHKAFAGPADEGMTPQRSLYALSGGELNIPEVRASLEEMRAKNTPIQGLEVKIESARMGTRTMALSARSFQTQSGTPMILLAIEDITDRRRGEDERVELLTQAQRAKEEAELANAAKDQFLAVLSHELRTPLSAMLMHAQLLRSRYTEDAALNHACEIIERGTRTQVQLIDDLLDVSRIASGKFRMDLQAVDLAAVARAAHESVSASAEKKSLKIEVEVDASVGKIAGDPMRLQQVLWNLLANAIKFTPEGGRVTMVLDVVDRYARVRVSDTGKGIEAGFLPHIFKRFTQEDSSRTRQYGGMGLGMAIVRHIVDSHGGTVHAESAGTNKGAIFTVLLPLMSMPGEYGDRVDPPDSDFGPPTEVPRKPSEPPRLGGLRVLVVDDDVGTREAVAEMLSHTGAQVRTVESAVDAMAAIHDFSPEILVCDIAMPSEDGYSFIRKVRALSPAQGGDIPAIALTALAGEDDRKRAFAAGFQVHLAKPVDIERLAEAVQEQAEHAGPSLRSEHVEACPGVH